MKISFFKTKKESLKSACACDAIFANLINEKLLLVAVRATALAIRIIFTY
jgi:hypothetical protein